MTNLLMRLLPRLTSLTIGAVLLAEAAISTAAISPPVVRPDAFQIAVGGQAGWEHDQGDESGIFNTFDALDLPGAYHRARKVHVFLPRDYHAPNAAMTRYPVAYFQDGSNVFFSDNGQGCWQMAQHLSDLYRGHALRQVIIVGIVSPDRNEEYTHAPVPTVETCCQLPEYASYVAHQLKPWIDANYRTLPGPSDTAIIGSSHGGLAAFWTAGAAPGIFGMVGAMSPSFWVDMTPFGPETELQSSTLMRTVGDGFTGTLAPRVYLDWGLVRTGGIQNSVIESNAALRGAAMAELLRTDFGYDSQRLHLVIDPAGDHSETSWGRRIGSVLTWFFGPPSGYAGR